MTVGHSSSLRIAKQALGPVLVLRVEGILDSTTYMKLRDSIVTAALEVPTAVVVDVTSLRIPAPSACAVFTSARWQVSRWPGCPGATRMLTRRPSKGTDSQRYRTLCAHPPRCRGGGRFHRRASERTRPTTGTRRLAPKSAQRRGGQGLRHGVLVGVGPSATGGPRQGRRKGIGSQCARPYLQHTLASSGMQRWVGHRRRRRRQQSSGNTARA